MWFFAVLAFDSELAPAEEAAGVVDKATIPKHQSRWTGFDDKTLSLYARGLTVREIQAHLEEIRSHFAPSVYTPDC